MKRGIKGRFTRVKGQDCMTTNPKQDVLGLHCHVNDIVPLECRSTCEFCQSNTLVFNEEMCSSCRKRKYRAVHLCMSNQSTCVDCPITYQFRPSHCIACWEDHGELWSNVQEVIDAINAGTYPRISRKSKITFLIKRLGAILRGA
jgi:hypothetical protein